MKMIHYIFDDLLSWKTRVGRLQYLAQYLMLSIVSPLILFGITIIFVKILGGAEGFYWGISLLHALLTIYIFTLLNIRRFKDIGINDLYPAAYGLSSALLVIYLEGGYGLPTNVLYLFTAIGLIMFAINVITPADYMRKKKIK